MKANIKMKNRKGQFYILTAVIFCSVMFMLISNRSSIQELNPEFKKLYDNYIYESPNVINNALYNNKNVSNQFKNYTSDFIGYAKEKNINLGVFYILKLGNEIEAVNYLNENVNITTINTLLGPNEHIRLNKTSNITIEVRGSSYIYNITEDKVQFKVLLIRQ